MSTETIQGLMGLIMVVTGGRMIIVMAPMETDPPPPPGLLPEMTLSTLATILAATTLANPGDAKTARGLSQTTLL